MLSENQYNDTDHEYYSVDRDSWTSRNELAASSIQVREILHRWIYSRQLEFTKIDGDTPLRQPSVIIDTSSYLTYLWSCAVCTKYPLHNAATPLFMGQSRPRNIKETS